MKNDEFPMFPELTDQGQVEAQELINKFKKAMLKASEDIIEEAMSEFYCDIVPYIESDSWTNFKNDLMDGFKNYDNRKIQSEYDFKEIRRVILEEYREEIINDLNQDHLEEIESLKKEIELMRRLNY